MDTPLYAKILIVGAGFSSLDASRPWIVYWIVHSLALLEYPLPPAPSRTAIISFLASCQHPEGGFGGGPYQLAHLATTYAAVAALVTIGGEDALAIVNRDSLLSFFLRMCIPKERGGGMTMHEGGEVDIRGCYCALAACYMLGMDVERIAHACSLTTFAPACQTSEGGLGGEPGNEAHGGYTFCGVAALALVDCTAAVDLHRLLSWASRLQGPMEGGFMGRTCKLVDGCYSFWQGALFPIVQKAFGNIHCTKTVESFPVDTSSSYKVDHVDYDQEYDGLLLECLSLANPTSPEIVAQQKLDRSIEILDACVHDTLNDKGQSDRDKTMDALARAAAARDAVKNCEDALCRAQCSAPVLVSKFSEGRDPQETCLFDPAALQFWILSACQGTKGGLKDKPGKGVDYYHTCYCLSGLSSAQHQSGVVLGGPDNLLAQCDLLCNVVADKLAQAREFFKSYT
jgi:protein farnesyltransferase subunit beta